MTLTRSITVMHTLRFLVNGGDHNSWGRVGNKWGLIKQGGQNSDKMSKSL